MSSMGITFDLFIFDFDGTLANSERAYSKAFHHSVLTHTGREISEEEFRGYWNATPQEVLSRYDRALIEEMMASFEEHYYANHHNFLTPYDGILEMLEHLNEIEARCAVVSLKPRRAGEIELDITGLRRFIDAAVWGDDVPRPKPEPDGVLRAVRELGADPRSTLVIGDSPADIMMGRAARARTAAALWNGADHERMIAQRPDFTLDSPARLLEIVGRSSCGIAL